MSHTGTYSHLAASLAWIAAMEQPGWHGWPVLAPQHGHGAEYSTRSSSSTAWFVVVPVVGGSAVVASPGSSSTPEGFGTDALEDGEQLHVSMVHVPFGPWQLIGAYSQRDV